MKLKCRPEDFRVEELPTIAAGERGRYTLYRLTKRGLGTPEALEAIRRQWNLAAGQIHYGGLKDRHAETIQYLSIWEGPQRALSQASFTLEPLGRVPFAYGPEHFRGNRFTVVLRDLTNAEARRAAIAAEQLPRDGLPNYFDDQRFGSVGISGEFIGEAWLRGDHERALRLAIAEPTAFDRPESRREKAILREFWGKWVEAKAKLDRSHSRSLVTYLVDHPTDFRGAFARLKRDLRSLYFSAFQSHLWNLMLARRIEQVTRPDQRILVPFKTATLPVQCGLEPDQAAALSAWELPLPACRGPAPEGPGGELAQTIVAERGLEWQAMRIKHLKDVFFSKGTRAAVFRPTALSQSQTADDLYPRKRALSVDFELPKGAYATLLVKRLTEEATVRDRGADA